ncbi:MAG: sulfotransferase family protein [Acidimicrobiales bacterium]
MTDDATLWSPGAGRSAMCLIGMHRSGTSLAARMLSLLGVSLGSAEGLLPPGPDNPAGYWENKSIQEFDDELLAALGGSWDQPPVLVPGWEAGPDLGPHRQRARQILDTDFTLDGTAAADARWIGFKDPRVSLLLPFWRTVLPIDTTIVVVRDPREVAGSLASRNEIDPAQAATLWMRYLFAATAADPGHLLLTHRQLFDDLDGTLAQMTGHLGLPPVPPDARSAIASHVDPDLRHHQATGPRPDENPVMELALTVWNDGRPDLTALAPALADAIGQGWLRPAADGEALAAARAEAVSFKEQLKRRNEKVRDLEAALQARAAGTGRSQEPG